MKNIEIYVFENLKGWKTVKLWKDAQSTNKTGMFQEGNLIIYRVLCDGEGMPFTL